MHRNLRSNILSYRFAILVILAAMSICGALFLTHAGGELPYQDAARSSGNLTYYGTVLLPYSGHSLMWIDTGDSNERPPDSIDLDLFDHGYKFTKSSHTIGSDCARPDQLDAIVNRGRFWSGVDCGSGSEDHLSWFASADLSSPSGSTCAAVLQSRVLDDMPIEMRPLETDVPLTKRVLLVTIYCDS